MSACASRANFRSHRKRLRQRQTAHRASGRGADGIDHGGRDHGRRRFTASARRRIACDDVHVDPRRIGIKAIVLSTFVFTLAHTLWLAAIVAGLAYALLYRSSGKLWCAVIAHAVTNGLLGIWVVQTGQWQFW